MFTRLFCTNLNSNRNSYGSYFRVATDSHALQGTGELESEGCNLRYSIFGIIVRVLSHHALTLPFHMLRKSSHCQLNQSTDSILAQHQRPS